MKDYSDYTIKTIPVLTINARDEDAESELRKICEEHKFDIQISEVSGFGAPELRWNKGNSLRGKGKIEEFIKFYSIHGHYEPFVSDGFVR